MNAIGLIKRLGTALMIAGLATAAQAQESATDVDQEVKAIVSSWEKWPGVFEDAEEYSAQIKKLADLGPAATPALIAALDATTNDIPLRLIPFTMRAIGDARAVPALIRALPKTLRAPGSDCGINLENRELLAFMQKNDLSAIEGAPRVGRDFGLGRPVREIAGALHKITGTKLNESELFGAFLVGSQVQQSLQKKAFYEMARNWAEWWGNNWRQFVNDPAFSEVHLPEYKAEALAGAAASKPNKAGDAHSGAVLSPVETGKNCALNIGLNRRLELPAEILGSRSTNRLEEVVAWAKQAGADLLGDEFRDKETGKSFYCLRSVGLNAWEVGNEEWDKIQETLGRGDLPPTNKPARELLMHFDEAKGRYAPEKKATFVFRTKDGVQGILRTTAQVTRPVTQAMLGMPLIKENESGADQRIAAGFDKGAQFEYQFFYTETEDMKREEAARVAARANREVEAHERKTAKLFQKFPKISGTVRSADGEAVSGAEVLLAIPGEGAVLGNRKFEYATRSTMVKSDAAGKYELPRVPAGHHLYVAHESGFGEADLEGAEPPATITLVPWAKIEGTIIRHGKPAPGEKLALHLPSRRAGESLTLAIGNYMTTSDENGRFVFENLPPGEMQVCRMLNNTYYEAKTVQVAAGKTTLFEHSFHGRTLKGKLVTSDASPVEWKSGRSFRFYTKPPSPLVVRRVTGFQTSFPVVISPNGEFKIEDVPAGVYNFDGTLVEGGGDEFFSGGRVLGRAKCEIVVPELDGNQDEAFSVGEIVVEMMKNVAAE